MHRTRAQKRHSRAYLKRRIDLRGVVTRIYPGPHVTHNLRPCAAVDKDDVAQPRKPVLVLAVQRSQLVTLAAEIGLLGDRLGRVELLLAQARMRCEDGQEPCPCGACGGGGFGKGPELGVACVDERRVGRVVGGLEDGQEG